MREEKLATRPVEFAGVRPPRRSHAARLGMAMIVAAALAIAVLVFGGRAFPGNNDEVRAGSQTERLVEQAARQLNAQAPLRIDSRTTMLGVSAQGNRIVYRMRVSEDVPAEEIADVQARLQAGNASELCSGTDTRRMIERGGVFDHRYSDASGDRFRTEVGSCAGRDGPANSAMPVAM